jgi:hypothetical protein
MHKTSDRVNIWCLAQQVEGAINVFVFSIWSVVENKNNKIGM